MLCEERFDSALKAVGDGKVGHIGLSSHDAAVSAKAIESGLIDVLMFLFNFFQHFDDAKRRVLTDARAAEDVGVVAMKSYYGGKLISSFGRPTGIGSAQCIQYMLSGPIAAIGPGVQNVEQMQQAIDSQQQPKTSELIQTVWDGLSATLKSQCVQCQHCLPCTVHIKIPKVIL